MPTFASLPAPPPKGDPRFDEWVKLLYQRVIQDDIVKNARAVITATSAGLNTTETIVVGGLNNAKVSGNTLKVGSTFRVVLQGTCTATVGNASTFRVRFGTTGTTADTAIGAATTAASAAAGTAIPFKVEIVFTVRTVGAAGTISGKLALTNQGTTGIATVVSQTFSLTVAALDTTVDNWLSVTYQSAAATTTATFQDASIEVVKP